MRRILVYVLIFIGLLAIPIVARYLRYYDITGAEREEVPVYEPANVPAMVPTPQTADYEDEPQQAGGKILLDMAHSNVFSLDELSELDRSLSARGMEFSIFEEGDLGSALRTVNGFVVVAPLTAFSGDEVRAVSDFVSRGGRLLLVGDPTRYTVEEDDIDPSAFVLSSDEIPLNSLASAFEIDFNGDYLYNTIENEGNFRNIILDLEDTRSSSLTDDLERLAFYGAHSVSVGPNGTEILPADENTWSSATDRPGGLAVAVMAADEGVLALGDLDFLDEPYADVFDNGQFLDHIADFLAGSGRDYQLADFPYFFQQDVNLVYAGDPELGADAFDEIIVLQDAFRRIDRALTLSDEPSTGSDVLYLGLYNQAQELEEILVDEGITLVIDPPIEEVEEQSAAEDASEDAADEDKSTEDGENGVEEEVELIRLVDSKLGSFQMSGTALILLVPDGDTNTLVVLTASADGLENTIDRLIALIPATTDQGMVDCLLQDGIALCPTGVEEEPVEAELKTGGTPELSEEEPAEEEEEAEEEPPDEEEVDSSFDAEPQGEIEIDQEVEGTLEAEQAHAWTFRQGPALVNIVLQGDDELDGVLELYGPDGELLGIADSSFVAGEERMDLALIETDEDYTIVVRDFFDDGGGYTLLVESADPADLDLQLQGDVAVGDSVEGTLDEGDVHGWELEVSDPLSVTVTLEADPALDGILVIFDPDGGLFAAANEAGPGLDEVIEAATLDTPGRYTIMVAGYNGSIGDYTLILE